LPAAVFRCKRDGVEEAFQQNRRQMGYSAEEAAFDCWRVVNANMSQGVQRTTAEKGIDPTDMVMLAYGGNGPAFAAIQAEDLGIDRVWCPKASPTFSALGTLVANPSIDEERSYIAPAQRLDVRQIEGALEGAGRSRRKVFRRSQFFQRPGELPNIR
jgi:N-methylhydantoinase A